MPRIEYSLDAAACSPAQLDALHRGKVSHFGGLLDKRSQYPACVCHFGGLEV